MKILYYCDWFKEYTANLALAVASEYNEVTLIARKSSPEFILRREDEEAVHSYLLENEIDLFILEGKYTSLKSIIVVNKIYRSKKNKNYDCFHIQQTGDPRFLWIAFRMKTILTLHETKARYGVVKETNLIRRLINRIVEELYRKLSNTIIVHTEGCLKGLSKREKRKTIVIPHGVKQTSKAITNNSNTILFFGRSAAYKGIDTLIEAMNLVWISQPNAQLRILASPGDFIPQMKLDSRIHATWDGYSNEELEIELSNSRVVCMPYKSAAGSGVGAQAYGAGKPIVASDLEGLRELVIHKELLVPPGNKKKLADALISSFLKDFACQNIDNKKIWPSVALNHISVYKTLCKS